MSGFWKFTSNYASKVSKILENENIILEDLLDERDTVSELLASNARLIEYLRRPEILEQLVDYIVKDDEYQRKSINNGNINCDDQKNVDNDLMCTPYNEKENDSFDKGTSLGSNAKIVDSLTDGISSHIIEEDLNVNKTLHSENDEKEANKDNQNNNLNEESDAGDKEAEEADDDDDNDDNEDDNEDEEEDDDDEEEEDGDDNIEETEDEMHNRRAQVAAEILSNDVWSITDTFMESTHLLSKLWCILDKPAPLPIFSATYFMKINEHLLDMKTDEMIQFIHEEKNLVKRFMRHIETPPLMDFLLKVISTDKPDDSTGIIDVLKEQDLIPSLLNFLSNNTPSSIQSASGDFLKAFITISANNAENTTIGPNELTRQLVSEPMVRLLIDKMLQGGTGLSNGVGIVIEIIRKNNSDYDPVPIVYVTIESHPPTPRDPIYLGTLVKIFAEKLPEFRKLLEQKVDKVLETPFGSIEPLGFERFKICELIAELIHCSNMALLNDQKGEELVKERDEIRELLIEKHKELVKRMEVDSTIEIDNADILKEIENLKLSRKNSADIDEEDINQNNDENDEENDEENDNTLIDDEEYLRENPVVGDQLKTALYDNKIIVTILHMFFKFPWNNFLHNVVFDIVQQILNATMEIGYNKYLAVDLFDRCHITKLIVDGHHRCIKYEEENDLRLGYMGHLSLIAEEVVKFISLDIHNTTPKARIIDEAVDNDEWKEYVDETLTDIRNKYNAVLGSDGKQMNEHDMNLFQKVYGSGDYEEEEEEEEEDDDEGEEPVIEEDEEQEEEEEGEEEGEEHDDNEDDNGDDYDDDNRELVNNHNNNLSGYIDSGSHETGFDKFSRYIGNEISNDLPDRFGSSDDESEDDDIRHRNNQSWSDIDNDNLNLNSDIVNSQMGGHPYHEMSAGGLDDENIKIDDEFDVDDNDIDLDDERYNNNDYDDDYDDYEDPNDDGKSYTKSNHPLYQADGSLRLSGEKILNDLSSA